MCLRGLSRAPNFKEETNAARPSAAEHEYAFLMLGAQTVPADRHSQAETGSPYALIADEDRVPRLLDQTMAQRFADGFGLGVDVKLFVDAADVIADRVDADIHLAGGVLIAVTFGQ